jgi:hypothetical protein
MLAQADIRPEAAQKPLHLSSRDRALKTKTVKRPPVEVSEEPFASTVPKA